jgi:hypothetical protein
LDADSEPVSKPENAEIQADAIPRSEFEQSIQAFERSKDVRPCTALLCPQRVRAQKSVLQFEEQFLLFVVVTYIERL